MIAEIKITCEIVRDGSDFGYQLRAPHHFTDANGIRGKTDKEFYENVDLSDKVANLIRKGWMLADTSLKDDEGINLRIDIGEGEIDFEGMPDLVKREVEAQINRLLKS